MKFLGRESLRYIGIVFIFLSAKNYYLHFSNSKWYIEIPVALLILSIALLIIDTSYSYNKLYYK